MSYSYLDDWDAGRSYTKQKSYAGSYGGSYWQGWESKYSEFDDFFKKKEKRREVKKRFEKIAKRLSIPLELRFGEMESKARKSIRFNLSLSDAHVTKAKTNNSFVEGVMNASERLPQNAGLLDQTLFNLGVFRSKERIPYKYIGTLGAEELKNELANYYAGVSPHEIEYFYAMFEENKDTEEAEKMEKVMSESEVSGTFDDRHLMNANYELVTKLTNSIKSKFFFPDVIRKEENYRKGNRISRGWINGTSYKPLIGKSVIAHKKKKLMVIIDGSGSMSAGGQGAFGRYHVGEISSCFSAGLIKSDLFEIKHMIIHHNNGWKNMLGEVESGRYRWCSAGSEGFENIDESIPEDYPRSADYVLFLTDMEIGDRSKKGMAAFLKRAKKHMILSFLHDGNLEGLNVRKIDSFDGMVNALSTLLA